MRVNSLVLALVIICSALATALGWILALPPQEIELPILSAAHPGKSAKASAAPLGARATNYEELSTRPLFTPSRRPASPQAATSQPIPAAPPRPLPAFTLLGTILAEDERIAFVKRPGQSHGQAVRLNETIEGWTVTAIEAVSIRLESGALKHVIAAEQGSASVPPRAPTSPSPPPRSNQTRR